MKFDVDRQVSGELTWYMYGHRMNLHVFNSITNIRDMMLNLIDDNFKYFVEQWDNDKYITDGIEFYGIIGNFEGTTTTLRMTFDILHEYTWLNMDDNGAHMAELTHFSNYHIEETFGKNVDYHTKGNIEIKIGILDILERIKVGISTGKYDKCDVRTFIDLISDVINGASEPNTFDILRTSENIRHFKASQPDIIDACYNKGYYNKVDFKYIVSFSFERVAEQSKEILKSVDFTKIKGLKEVQTIMATDDLIEYRLIFDSPYYSHHASNMGEFVSLGCIHRMVIIIEPNVYSVEASESKFSAKTLSYEGDSYNEVV